MFLIKGYANNSKRMKNGLPVISKPVYNIGRSSNFTYGESEGNNWIRLCGKCS